MTVEHRLPDLLHDLAAGVHAPATLEVDRAVHHRTAALRRHRRTRRAAAAAGLVTASVLTGVVWLADTDPGTRPDVSTDPADGGTDIGLPPGEPGVPPALTIDGATAVTSASESTVEREPALPAPVGTGDVGRQIFRRPGDYAGPLAFVTTGPLDQLVDQELDGHLGQLDADVDPVEWFEGGVRTRVTPIGDGQHVRVDALGLTAAEVTALAHGLERRDQPSGWDATVLPAGLEELRVDPPPPASLPYAERVLELTVGPEERPVRILTETVDDTDPAVTEAAFLHAVWNRRTAAEDEDVQQVEVLGRPALLVGASRPEPELLWRHTTTGLVDIHLPAADPATLAGLIDGIREISAGEWDQLADTVRRSS